MQGKQSLSVLAVLFTAGSLFCQEKPASIFVVEFQKPKNGMIQQYEAGRKQKAAWHKQQNDPHPLFVWETISGESTGTYLVGEPPQPWAEMDKPAIPDESDEAEYQKVIGTYVESRITRYYEYLLKISDPDEGNGPTKFSEILIFHVRYGKNADFRSAIDQVTEAARKTKWSYNFEWYELVNGGTVGEYALVLPHKNWADFQDRPDVKPFREMLKEAFGQAQTDSIVKRIDESVQEETSEILQFRPDLSYLPGK